MIKTTVLQFMLEALWKCTILCFLLANCYGINWCNVFIGQYNQNDRNSFECCALSGPQKHITKESDWFHNHSTQLTMMITYHLAISIFVKAISCKGIKMSSIPGASWQSCFHLHLASPLFGSLYFLPRLHHLNAWKRLTLYSLGLCEETM